MIESSKLNKFFRRWNYCFSISMVILLFVNSNEFFSVGKIVNASSEHSEVINLDTDEIEILSVQSEPFGSYLEMEFYVRFKSNVEVVLIDSKGKTLERKLISVNEGKNKFRFETSTPLVHGPYFVSLVLNDRRITKKIEAE